MSTTGELERALAACLEQMSADGSDADAALSRFPDLADDLRPLLALAAGLEAIPPIPGPTETFRSQLAAALTSAPTPTSLVAEAKAAAPEAGEAPTAQLVHALDECLAVGPEGAAEHLAARPELAGELTPLVDLAEDMRRLPAVPAPSDAFRAALASDLASAPVPRSVADWAAARGGWTVLRRLWRSTAFTAAAAATVFLFIAAGAVYASADALPRERLYPVKRTTERVRLWLEPNDTLVALHLDFADRRMSEALADSDHSGAALADFSRECTIALAIADAALARGEPRDGVTAPLLVWFSGARVHLIDGRAVLPPTAWRASLALVDEAIAALQSGRPLAVAPVPRLGDAAARLRLRAPVRRQAASQLEARQGRRNDVLAARGGGNSDDGDTDGQGEAQTGERLVYVVATASPEVVASAADAPTQPEPPSAPQDGTGGLGSGQPPPTDPPPPTREPRQQPTKPRHDPTAPGPAPTEPAVPPAETPTTPPTGVPPTVTGEPPTVPPPTSPPTSPPTVAPSPTPTAVPVINKDPIIHEVVCDDAVLDLNKSTTCHVVALDPEGEALHYMWASDAPQMLNERQRDATYYAAWGVGGGVLRVRITVLVSDRGEVAGEGPGVVRGETYVDVRSLDNK